MLFWPLRGLRCGRWHTHVLAGLFLEKINESGDVGSWAKFSEDPVYYCSRLCTSHGPRCHLDQDALELLNGIKHRLFHRDVVLPGKPHGFGPVVHLVLGKLVRPGRVSLSRCSLVDDVRPLGVRLAEDVGVRLWRRVRRRGNESLVVGLVGVIDGIHNEPRHVTDVDVGVVGSGHAHLVEGLAEVDLWAERVREAELVCRFGDQERGARDIAGETVSFGLFPT